MTTTREQILTVLFAALATIASPAVSVKHNAQLAERIDGGAALVIQQDGGDPAEPVETILGNPPIYSYDETVEIEFALAASRQRINYIKKAASPQRGDIQAPRRRRDR
jgi:hypothetical protein